MTYALEPYFGLPLSLGYLVSALMALPFIAILIKHPELPAELPHFGGAAGGHGSSTCSLLVPRPPSAWP